MKRIAIVLATIMLASALAPASKADDIEPPQPPEFAESNDLAPEVPNPAPEWVCIGRSFKPYKSGDNVLASSETDCPVVVDIVFVSAWLARHRWYGWQNLDFNSKQLYDDIRAGVTTGKGCALTGTYTYRNKSYHEVWIGTKKYTANTEAQNRFSC